MTPSPTFDGEEPGETVDLMTALLRSVEKARGDRASLGDETPEERYLTEHGRVALGYKPQRPPRAEASLALIKNFVAALGHDPADVESVLVLADEVRVKKREVCNCGCDTKSGARLFVHRVVRP